MLICFKEDCSRCMKALMDCIVIKGEMSESILEKVLVLEKLGQSYGVTLLHYTPECDSAEVSKHLLEIGCDVKNMNRTGHTPLTTVIEDDGIRTVEVLLKNNGTICVGDPSKMNEYERVFYHMFLHNAPLKLDHRRVLQWFADKKSKDFATSERATMHLLRGYKDLVKLGLVAAGSVELAKFVLVSGHDIKYRVPKTKWTALHVALILGKFQNAKMLIECGADVNAVDNYGKIPLSYYIAVENVDEKSEVLSMLFDRLKNSAVSDLEKILVEGRKETVKVVLQRIDVGRKRFSGGRDLLHLLIENTNEDVLDVLEEVDVPFDVNSRIPTGETALMLAAHAGFVRKVEFLLRQGVDVNSTLDSGESALFYAINTGMRGDSYSDYSRHAEANRMSIVFLLLQNGADVQVVPKNGKKTLIDYLSMRRKVNTPMTKVFVAHLALLAATDELNLTDYTRDKIQSDETLKSHFDSFMKQLDEMKNTKLYGSVTLFKLLSERQGKIMGYARNPDLISAFNDAMEGMSEIGYYYGEVLLNKMESAKMEVELMAKAATVVEELTGISTDAFHIVAYKIVGYLDSRDMKKLCEL